MWFCTLRLLPELLLLWLPFGSDNLVYYLLFVGGRGGWYLQTDARREQISVNVFRPL